jgi:crossover junction endodeoxyribonuclease RuvC
LIILGLDLGSRNVGASVIETYEYKAELPKLLKADYIHLTADKIGDRMNVMLKRLEKYIEDDLVDLIIFEDGIFRGANGPYLNYIAGVFHLAAAIYDVPIKSAKPTQIKKELTGNGKADKNDVEAAVLKILSNPPEGFVNDHVSDSVSVGLYWYLKHGHNIV